ncbi:alpha-hydroxy acid oxidase [Ideonella sp.]|jgi:4-hydroxymandelate oxidase|uniref:alpha-hydroxy acid oxidase n=1 Tax=Ideonella sp. TaxID=1929293 RepID=UPI0037C02F69
MAATAFNLRDFESQAFRTLPAAHWAYLHGSAADGDTACANQQDWQDLRLWPRVLNDLRPGNEPATAIQVAGRTMAHPIFLAPVAYQQLAHPEGERATALAAAAQGAGMVLSAQSSTAMEVVAEIFAAEPEAGPLWFQLYWQGGLERSLALVERAQCCGFEGIVLTVDAPVHGVRDAERRAGFVLPAGIQAVNLAPTPARNLSELLAQAPRWDDVRALQAACAQRGLPLWLKGVLHPDDARRAVELGVSGLVVSNHGGRTLDTAVSTAWALPRVRAAVPADFPLLVDGGIRRGTDVFKALALGANAVLVGRPQVHALASEGAMGVARMIRLLRDEFAATLALCACAAIADIHTSHLVPPPADNIRHA